MNPQAHVFETFYYPLCSECGCGKKAEYEVFYENVQLHCRSCMEDAVDCDIPVLVRRMGRD